jgi:hypothetical protein
MDFSGIIQQMDAEWDTNGFFDRVRRGDYDAKQAQGIIETLRAISIGEDEQLPKRLVSLLWYLPSFLGWQVERVAENGGDRTAYERFVAEITNVLEEVLGTP